MEITIDMVVDTSDNPISVEDLANKFIDWVEENGWTAGGGIFPTPDEKE